MPSTWPGRSIVRPSGFFDSGAKRAATIRPAIPTGTFRKNTLCQPSESTRSPPTTGPSASARPDTPAQSPMACARSRGSGNVCVMIESVLGIRAAAPTPCSAREAIRNPMEPDRPQSSEPSEKMIRPAMKSRLRPNRSPSVPPVSSRLANSNV